MGKLWGGRFDARTDELMGQFNASIDFDQRLAPREPKPIAVRLLEPGLEQVEPHAAENGFQVKHIFVLEVGN